MEPKKEIVADLAIRCGRNIGKQHICTEVFKDTVLKPNEFIVKVTPEGDIFFLYSDNSPLRDLGNIKLTRASNVEWNEKEQGWVVWVNDLEPKPYAVKSPSDVCGKIKRRRLLTNYRNRGEAIRAEIEVLNERLLNGTPVEQLFSN